MVPNGTGGRRHSLSVPDEHAAARRALRIEMRMRRRKLGGFRRHLANRAIVAAIRSLPAYRAARSLALFWPADGEPDIRGIAAHARARGKRVYLPVVEHSGRMRFAAWPAGGRLRKNRYGIPEPFGRRLASAASLDLLIMPLVAFDARGHRLGMGGGYYDRALANRRLRPALVGAAFSCQETRALPTMPWDVPMDLVVTERGRRHKGARRP